MPQRLKLKEGSFYHIQNRGASDSLVFRANADRERFRQLLFLCNSPERIVVRDVREKHRIYQQERASFLVDIGAYVLTPQGFELMVHERAPGGASRFMQKLQTGYSMYFKSKYDCAGKIFAGSYKAREVAEGGCLWGYSSLAFVAT